MAKTQANKKTAPSEGSLKDEKPAEETTELPPLPSGKGAKKDDTKEEAENVNAQVAEEGPKYTLFSLLTRGENRGVAIPFALTALAMFIVPVAVFFLVESALPDLGITDKNKVLSYSGVSAVISANIIMALYAFHAYREEKRDWAAVQEKKRQNKKKD